MSETIASTTRAKIIVASPFSKTHPAPAGSRHLPRRSVNRTFSTGLHTKARRTGLLSRGSRWSHYISVWPQPYELLDLFVPMH
jgi:hypothetical protein